LLRRVHRAKRRLVARRLRKELERRRGDDPERPFGADQEILEIVAGVVLLEGIEPVVEPAVGQYSLDPEAELSRIAIGQHLHAAGVGAEDAADARRALAR